MSFIVGKMTAFKNVGTTVSDYVLSKMCGKYTLEKNFKKSICYRQIENHKFLLNYSVFIFVVLLVTICMS